MKANLRPAAPLPLTLRFLVPPVAAALMLAIAGCSEQRVIPRPTPTPTVSKQAPTPPPAAPSRTTPAGKDWIDMPATPGNWSYRQDASGSLAEFAGGLFSLRCDPSTRTIALQRGAVRTEPGITAVPMTIATTQSARALTSRPVAAGVVAMLGARDPLLDAMAFSRGRFAVEVSGASPLYLPAWAEVSRVIEDCR